MPNQTRNIATNTFTKGLIMDFDPTVTQNDRLVNALNATLLTFNGNEMTLQQDMGNGRVETAFLPEGYVPVGTCEFGDIIYIVSYNPLENKSQIGCFPSPERNITSDEISDMQQSLENSDFQQETNGTPTGVLNATSVKKIVYGNNNMNPGDRFIIYEEDSGNTSSLSESSFTLSDYGNTSHKHDTWPKLLKLSIVSIEDSGKIVDLNASVKWYDNDYYLAYLHSDGSSGTPDLDSYRSLVSSAYSVFQSKVSGKLAILAELETIDGFSCTYDVYINNLKQETDSSNPTPTRSDDEKCTPPDADTEYHIYFYTSWETSHNDVNPTGFILTKSAWTTEENGGLLFVPQYDNGVVRYEYDTCPIQVPVESAWSEAGWDSEQVKEYTRLYELGSDADDTTFEDYISTLSYNAQIDDIIDWKKEGMDYTALAEGVNIDKVRLVTKATRVRDTYTGEPLAPEGVEKCWKYVYNADSVKDGVYSTKLSDGSLWELQSIELTDDVVNNYFKKDIPKLVASDFRLPRTVVLDIPTGETESDDAEITTPQTFDVDLSKMVWNYEVAPVMPYGVLDYMAIAGQIDFSKLGSGVINITDWRYYNSGSVSTLTWGLEVYPETNKGVAEVVFDFFDNQGYAASWHTSNKTSYSGTFTDTIVLNQKFPSYKMNITDATGDSDHIHAGEVAPDGPVQITTNNRAVPTGWKNPDPNDPTEEGIYGDDCYEDNAGSLVSNCLYLVKITVKYCTVDLLDNYDTDNDSDFRVFYRWYWTNGMLNESYYNVRDFDVLIPQLQLDDSVTFDTRGTDTVHPLTISYIPYYHADEVQVSELEEDGLCKTLGAQVYAINQKGDDDEAGNILMTVSPSLTEPFDTFNLNEKALDILNVTCSMGESSITKTIDTPSLQYTGDQLITGIEDNIQPVVATELRSYIDVENKEFDRSGYVSYDYGSNYKCVGNNLLTLLEVSRDKSYDPVDKSQEGELPDKCQELYDTKDAYESYLDSFSLNLTDFKFVIPTDDHDSLTYYDSNGSEKTVDWYQYKTLPADEAMDSTKGFALSLAGIAYSKINSAKYDSTEVKMLRSVIRNCTGETYSPEMLGLHNYKSTSVSPVTDSYYHLYFNDLIGFLASKYKSAKPRLGTMHSIGITRSNWTGSTRDYSYDKEGHDDSVYKLDFTSSKVQDLWSDYVRYPFTAFTIGKIVAGPNGAKNTFSKNSSWSSLKSAFDYTADSTAKKYIHHNEDDIPYGSDTDKWGSRRVFYTIAIRSSDGTIVPMNDWFIGYDGNTATQAKEVGDNFSTRPNVPVMTLGDMVGSLFAQLYVVDPNTHIQGAILSDTVTLQDYTEYWNKDIVIDMNVNDDASSENIHELLCIQRQTMTNYLKYLQLNSGVPDFYESDEINTYNIDIGLVSARQTIAFQYAVPYNLRDLVYVYEDLGSPRNRIALSYPADENGNQLQEESFRNSAVENTLYTWDGEEIMQFSTSSTIYYAAGFGFTGNDGSTNICTEGELYMIKNGDETMSTNGFSDLIALMNYQDGNISWGDYTNLTSSASTYDIRYTPRSGNEDKYICLENLPRTSFFRFHNPQ